MGLNSNNAPNVNSGYSGLKAAVQWHVDVGTSSAMIVGGVIAHMECVRIILGVVEGLLEGLSGDLAEGDDVLCFGIFIIRFLLCS